MLGILLNAMTGCDKKLKLRCVLISYYFFRTVNGDCVDFLKFGISYSNIVILFSTGFEPRQAIEVSKRQAKAREGQGNADLVMKLEAAEAKLQDLKSNMGILGKEAAAAMAAVEAQQQRLTLQRLIAMVMQNSNFQIRHEFLVHRL